MDIRFRLQAAAINLLGAERNGEAFDSQLVIGVRESYGASVMCVCVCHVTVTLIFTCHGLSHDCPSMSCDTHVLRISLSQHVCHTVTHV